MKSRYSLLAFFFILAAPAGYTQSTPPQVIHDTIAAVETNLTGKVMIEGTGPWTLSDRLAHYHVKGVSIAVIHHYTLAWAKGYGWADERTKVPVTPQTLFQAASISKSLNAVGSQSMIRPYSKAIRGHSGSSMI